MKRYILVLFLGLMMTTACSSANLPVSSGEGLEQPQVVQSGSFANISVPELQEILTNKDFTFVNVHVPFEGDIPDTDLSIPFDQIEGNLDKLPSDKDAKIVLYCRSGSMSNIAAKSLVELGYTNVWNLEGGFNAWKAAGLPMAGD